MHRRWPIAATGRFRVVVPGVRGTKAPIAKRSPKGHFSITYHQKESIHGIEATFFLQGNIFTERAITVLLQSI